MLSSLGEPADGIAPYLTAKLCSNSTSPVPETSYLPWVAVVEITFKEILTQKKRL